MPFCEKCGKPVEETAKFCRNCGEPLPASESVEPAYSNPGTYAYPTPENVLFKEPEPVAPVYAEPAVPVYSVPIYPEPAEPVVSVKTKVLGFVGMGVSIFGLFFAVFGLLYTLIGMSEVGLGFGFAIGFNLFSLPCGIVGMVLSNQSRNAGNIAKSASVGAKLGLASVIVSGVMLFLGFVNLMA